MNYKLSLSVHDLVDFVLRTGDIDARIFNNATMLEGSRIHRYYQAKMDSNYISEMFLSYDFAYQEFDIHIEGRADGIIVHDDYVVVDEIKSCVGDIEEFHKKNESWHLGQAKVYGFLYCKKTHVNKIDIVLTYISQEDRNDIKKYFYSFTYEELEYFFNDLVNEYTSFQRLIFTHKNKVRTNLNEFKFPYKTLNLYQNDLINYVNDIENISKARALIEAPTGIGKTISVLYPSIKNLKKYDRIFYLTAKNSGKEIVNSTLINSCEANLHMKSIILTAKDKICPMKEVVCNPDSCPFAKNYFDKIRNALLDSFFIDDIVYNEEFIKEMSFKYEICPFEYQLDLSLFCDLIVGDYNYVFDPFVYLERYMDKDVSNTLLLVDEGHNLLDRCRNMYSVSFGIGDLIKAKKSLKKVKKQNIKNNINKIINYLTEIGENIDEYGILEVEEFDESFIKLLNKFHELYTQFSSLDSKSITREYKDLFNEINRLLKLYEIVANEVNFNKYFKKLNNENVDVNIYCTSPTKYINSLTNKFKNSIIFSATLTPFNYYNELFFNNDNNTNVVAFDSPFDSSRLNLNISQDVSIKYKDRLNTLDAVISQIVAFISAKKGKYFVFVPSYEYLKLLKQKLNIESVDFIYQEKEMKEIDRKNFIANFTENSTNTKVGICVLGGSFSESINLVGENLIGVIVVGVGMPSVSYENNAVKNYYELIGLNGFYYAYVIPGMKNVIQSIGRLIRSKTDYGSVLLIDERYSQTNYKKLFRKEWKNIKIVKNDYEIIENLNIFYKKILNQ